MKLVLHRNVKTSFLEKQKKKKKKKNKKKKKQKKKKKEKENYFNVSVAENSVYDAKHLTGRPPLDIVFYVCVSVRVCVGGGGGQGGAKSLIYSRL